MIGIRNVLACGLPAPFAGGRVQIHKIEERLLIDDFLVKLAWPIQRALRYELVADGIICNEKLKIRAVIGPFGERSKTHETQTEDKFVQSLGCFGRTFLFFSFLFFFPSSFLYLFFFLFLSFLFYFVLFFPPKFKFQDGEFFRK
jgi:hypothetical protein